MATPVEEATGVWSIESETSLTEIWENHPCLYAITSKEYRDRSKRDAALQEMTLTAALDMTGSTMAQPFVYCFLKQAKITFLLLFILASIMFYVINHTNFIFLFKARPIAFEHVNLSIAINKVYYPEVKTDTSGMNYTNPRTRVSNHQKLISLQKFLNISKFHGIAVFLIDPKILNSINKNIISSIGDRACQFLCHPTNLITFGIYYDAISDKIKKQKFLTDLHKHVFNWTITNVSKAILPYLNTNETDLPAHIFLHQGVIFHLVVFHKRGDEPYFWTDKIDFQGLKKPDFVNFYYLNYGKFPAAFDYFENSVYILDGIHLLHPSKISLFLSRLKHSQFMECNHSYAQTFHSKYPKKDPKAAADFISTGKILLREAKKGLNSINVPFQLNGGTLLGWYRQCDLDYEMKDMDIEVFYKDYDRKIFSTVTNGTIKKMYQFGKEHDSLEFSFSYNSVKLDLFVLYEDSDYFWIGGVETSNLQKYKFVYPKYTPCMAEFLGVLVRIPCDFLSSLKTNFGDNFMVPSYEFEWASSPKNIFKNGGWKESERKEVIQSFNT